jgi:hypothetical protein
VCSTAEAEFADVPGRGHGECRRKWKSPVGGTGLRKKAR